MNPTRTSEGIRIGGDALQRLHHARGYGMRIEGTSDILLAPVEAAYLLYRGDIPSVDGDDFTTFLRDIADDGSLVRFFVYKDLRERGFYLAPRTESIDFTVFQRGTAPAEGQIAHNVEVIDERQRIPLAGLDTGVLALVDEEGEVGYVEIEHYDPGAEFEPVTETNIPADLLGNRAVVWEPDNALYELGFYGQPLAGRNAEDSPLQLSLVEALYLANREVLDISTEEVRLRGHAVEGVHQFEARARVYRALRESGVIPKTGFKFGADFRVYHDFESIEQIGHSDILVRVLDHHAHISPAALALDVRLAHGVGKRMVFALTNDSESTTISWLSITRITP